MITIETKGNFKHCENFLQTIVHHQMLQKTLDDCGKRGVEALAAATPKDTGKTAASWDYGIERKLGSIMIYWTNSNVNDGVPIAVILQYGHGTASGAYVEGRDYINPAIAPIFDQIAEDAWKEVTDA